MELTGKVRLDDGKLDIFHRSARHSPTPSPAHLAGWGYGLAENRQSGEDRLTIAGHLANVGWNRLMDQIVAIGSKHSPELSLNFWIQRDAVGVGAVNGVLVALGRPMHVGFRVLAGTIVVVLIFALAHSGPRVPRDWLPELGAIARDARRSPLFERAGTLIVP